MIFVLLLPRIYMATICSRLFPPPSHHLISFSLCLFSFPNFAVASLSSSTSIKFNICLSLKELFNGYWSVKMVNLVNLELRVPLQPVFKVQCKAVGRPLDIACSSSDVLIPLIWLLQNFFCCSQRASDQNRGDGGGRSRADSAGRWWDCILLPSTECMLHMFRAGLADNKLLDEYEIASSFLEKILEWLKIYKYAMEQAKSWLYHLICSSTSIP